MTIDYARVCDAAVCGPVPAALGARFVGFDLGRRELRVAFDSTAPWRNGLGVVQGGILCAMLDFCCTASAVCASGFGLLVPTLEMKTSFIGPASGATLLGTGRVLRLGHRVAFLEGELHDDKGLLVARASATAMPQARQPG